MMDKIRLRRWEQPFIRKSNDVRRIPIKGKRLVIIKDTPENKLIQKRIQEIEKKTRNAILSGMAASTEEFKNKHRMEEEELRKKREQLIKSLEIE